MQHFHDEWIQEWCDLNGWTDLVRERYNSYWAFPPNCVMPEPIPQKVMRLIKSEKGLSHSEQKLSLATVAITVLALVFTCLWMSPMPLILAFGFSAISFAKMECEI
ncbi:hypothetical protein I4641_14085 [Waterburya agarophytonicola K14]|uniref:Uncharacterized protein n=1 Tax=Waterburya agarophytonicola KI4 TaxID=2874699 RepID=A0A964BRI3_9CYAN|nr:hypothetical protein [Waterburya agarophytonicola]MCC0178110.1 hypothetical protein [Waterburya agarophytonicola KI4]